MAKSTNPRKLFKKRLKELRERLDKMGPINFDIDYKSMEVDPRFMFVLLTEYDALKFESENRYDDVNE